MRINKAIHNKVLKKVQKMEVVEEEPMKEAEESKYKPGQADKNEGGGVKGFFANLLGAKKK